MKLRLLALLGMGLGAQVCVGAELDKEKKPKLWVDVGDQRSTMVPVKKKPGRQFKSTPHHTNKKFFAQLKAVNKVAAQLAQDMVPGAEHMEESAGEPVKPRVVLGVPKAKSEAMQVAKKLDIVEPEAIKAEFLKKELQERHTKHIARVKSYSVASHHLNSLESLMSGLEEVDKEIAAAMASERMSPESPSPRGDIAIAKAARQRSNSEALLATALGETREKESQEKADDFKRKIELYRGKEAQRLTMSGKQVS